ncbi:conserved hypothetical protein [Leishmania major strain Friedlin]|uniref:Uncharacterized protein n=1 Tax=Leishmania major TaxID=5664 RepID=Q4QFB4_LEIMA|nr:conserved hypothetical protein [Leishmania major strain Friedlin]CAG9571428.1 hypothetical_protein_-_conserved [Leishmania major strain Friedlin]CAJ03295.1 conserved hypothetical protein [Leishmania major strain Friedlin]|eukprot:XP_001681984.1 conserved hypothetical protein [Leishmania major strain Friedlin]
MSASTPASTPAFTGAPWYRAFQLFSEAVQQHHVSPTAQHFNLLLYIAQQHALWGRVDEVEEFWAHLLSSVQQLRREKMRDQRRAEQAEWKGGEKVGRHRTAPELEQLTSSSPSTHAPPASASPSSTTTPTPAITAAALTRQMDELNDMEQALMPNAQTYELLLGGALARGMWGRALEYCALRTRSGVATMTDTSVRQVLQAYILAETSGTVTHATRSHTEASPSSPAPYRLRTGERGQLLRAAAQPQRSSNHSIAHGGSAQESYWSAALHFFRRNFHRVSSMHTVWCMVTLLHRANHPAELVHVVREDSEQLVQTSLRSLAAHGLTSVERAALLRTLKMVSDAACELGDWRTALQVLREVVELRHQLLSKRTAALEQFWGAPHPSGEAGMPFAAVAGGNPASRAPGAPLSHTTTQHLAPPDLIGAGSSDEDARLDEVQLSRYVLKNTLHTLRRVRRYAHVIDVYRDTLGLPAAAVDAAAGAAREEEDDDGAVVWRSMWTPSAVGYVAQAALAVRDLDLLLELCGLTPHGLEVATDNAAVSLSTPTEVYDATLRLIQYHIVRQRCEEEKSGVCPSTTSAAEKGRDRLQWDVLSQRVYGVYRQRALRTLAEETSPYHAYLKRTCHALSSGGEGHTAVALRATAVAAVAELDAPLLSTSHKPLIQLLAQSLQSGVDSSTVTTSLQEEALKHLQRIRRPDTLAIALVMDILRSEAFQHRFSGEEAELLLAAVQQVLNAILAEQHIEPIHLLSTSPHGAATHAPNGSGSAQSQHSSRYNRSRSGSAFPAASRPGAAEVGSKLTPAQLASLSTLTAAAVHMSFDILARVQPLTLLAYIPACVELAWLPSAAAPAQLQLAQQAVVQWADEELKRGAVFTAEPQRAAMAQMKPAADGIVGSGGAAATRRGAMDASPAAIEASGRSAVAHFVLTYTQFFSRKAITSDGTPPLVAGSSTAAAVASGRAVLDAAAQVLVQLQRSKPGHPPTAAMSAFISALRHAWTEKTSLAHGPLPLETTLPHNAELELVVVTSLNAVVQQVGASTVSRWTMWGDCVDMLMTYMDSPLATTRRRETQMEKAPAAVMQSRPDSWRRAEATYETLRVLHMFIRLCDKAETGFVERVTMDWLLLGANSTRSSSTGGGECAYRESSDKDAARHSMVITPVEHLRCLCELAHKQLRRTPPAPHEPFSPPELESMQLLLDALTWACRRHAKPLVRRLYGTLAPWLDTLLEEAAPPPPPLPTSPARSVAAGAEAAVEKGELLHQQLSRLRETALTACMTVAQCLSSGPRVEVLQDWQLQLRVLRQLTNQGNGPVPLSDFGSQRKVAALIDGIAAVAVKLKRTWRYLLTELALDSHRAVGEARRRQSASSSLPPLQLPEAALRHRKGVEDAAEAFAAWCSAELLPRLVLSCLRACVEHEALRSTPPTIAPPPGATPSSPRALVTAALHKVVDAVWDIDFAAFVWKVYFCAREGVDDDGARVQTLARLRTRGYHILSMELCWPNPDGASQQLARHLYMWILFTVHGAPVRAAVAELCRDVATLDVFHGTQRATTCAAAQSGASAAGCTATAASPMPFFLLFAQEVDTLTEAKVAEALSYAGCANPAATAAAGTDDSSSHVAELARMADGRTAMEYLTKPLVHYTPSVLRVVQQAAQRVLYLALCEGTADVQAAGGVAKAAHVCSFCPFSVVAQTPRSVGCAVTGRAALPSALLLCRCLAWTGQAHAYHALLRVIEAAAHETLREPEAVVYVFRYMERLGRAAESADAATRDGETILSSSPVEAFLAFYMSSTTLRRASPVSERVCLAALLACAANTRRGDAAASPPTVDLLTLLTAFTHVVSDHLVTEWQQGRLSPHQSAVLTEWMLRFLWGGVPVSPMDASTASLKRYGVVNAAAADGNVTVVASAALPLRRASMQWLLVTRGSIVPPPLRDEGAEASTPSACAAGDSAPQTPPSRAAASAERIVSLVASLDRASQRFEACLGGVVVSPSAAAALGDDSSCMLSRESLASELPPRHLPVGSPSADENLVRTVLQQLSTRHAAQQLLRRYQSPHDALRSPVRVQDTEAEALVQALPEDARDSAKATLRGGADLAASYDGDSARKASRQMARSHARQSVRPAPAANEEEAAELESWLDAAVASLASTTPGFAPPPPLPVILRCPEQEGGRTWSALYMQLLSITKNVHQGREERAHSTAGASESLHDLDGYVRRRAVLLRPALLRLMSNLADTSSRLDPASPSPDGDVGPCVCSLLLMCYVLLPLRSLRPPPSLAEVLAVVRQELWRLLLACSSASGAGQCAPHASGYLPRTSYNALVQLCVRPLMLEALPQLRLPTFASSESGAAAFEAVASGLLLVHRVSADVFEIRALSSTLADTAAIYTSHRSTVPDANAVNALQQTAREFLHLAGQELYHLHTSSGLAASSPEPLQMLYRRLVRAWMQAGVLLGDARSLLWCGQRLTAWSLQKQQEATALAWIAEGYGAVSASTAQSSEVAEADAATEWLCVLPVAVLLAAVCSPALRSSTGVSEALLSLASVLPLPHSIRDTVSNSQDGSGVVSADEYVSLFRHWQQLLQGRVTEAASRHRGCQQQRWLLCHRPFAVILHGSVPADATLALVEAVRRQVEEYLAGSATWYPPQSQQVTPVSSDVAPALGGGDSSSSSSHATIAAADLCAAFQCVTGASERDMRAFMRLEAAKRTPGGKGVVRGEPKKALEVQAAWRLIHRAALQERQQCGSGIGAAAAWTPLVPPAAWRAYLLHLHPVVPHSVHFVPMAVTEVLMLQSCTTWTEGLAVIEHSLGTLHRSGATPVQQYMAQLLLERVRRTEGSAEGFKTADGRVEEHHFCAGLETYTYMVQQQPTEEETSGGKPVAFPRWRLWLQHMARRSTHGTAALVCRIFDLMFIHHMQTTRASARDTITCSPSVLAKHTLMEALRCGVHDPALTRVLFRLFWVEQHRRVEGAHVFLSALRAAKLARSDALALEAMLTYLRVSDPNAATTQRTTEWSSRVLQVISACEARATIPGSRVPSSGFSSASAWQHLKVAAEEAAELQGPTHRFSVEAHRATWKSWTVLCRLQVVPKDVALCVVHLFKQYDRLTEVEELMVATCYDMTMAQAERRVGGGDTEE